MPVMVTQEKIVWQKKALSSFNSLKMRCLMKSLLAFIFLVPFLLFSNEMAQDAKIYVAGHRGLVGSAIVRKLQDEGYHNIVTRTSSELDLRDQKATEDFFEQERPEYVFLAAAKVGGIHANNVAKGDFIYNNLQIEINVIHSSYKYGVKKLLFLGSNCIYPRDCPQPINEDSFMTGPLEKTNDAYAIAKIAGIQMCQAYNDQYGTRFIACMPTNLYGPGDNYDLETSHVFPALVRKFVEAKRAGAAEVPLWGTGVAIREFLHVDDAADACLFLMENHEGNQIVNVGTGQGVSIRELAEMIGAMTGFEGKLTWDSSKPNGTPVKISDTTRINQMGWYPSISLEEGLERTIAEYRALSCELH